MASEDSFSRDTGQSSSWDPLVGEVHLGESLFVWRLKEAALLETNEGYHFL